MIRKPKESETADCLRLMYMSGPDMWSYFLAAKEPEIYEHINVFYTKPDLALSRENVLVSVEDEKVRGLLLAVPVKDMKQMDKNMMKYGKELYRVAGIVNAIKIMLRSGLQKHMDVFTEDEYYVSNLAVFEAFRGKGVGAELLEKAEELAGEKGYAKLVLVVEYYNKEAKRIYEKHGFIETMNVAFPKKYHKHGVDGFYKMEKTL